MYYEGEANIIADAIKAQTSTVTAAIKEQTAALNAQTAAQVKSSGDSSAAAASSGSGNTEIILKVLTTILESTQQLNNTIYEVTLGIGDGIYKKTVDGEPEFFKPEPELFATRKINSEDKNIVDVLSVITVGKKVKDILADGAVKGVFKNTVDVLSTVITGKKYSELILEKEGGDTGMYDSTLNGRLHKTTELLTGIIAGIFTEDKIKGKLEGLNIHDKDSLEAQLGKFDVKASFLKNNIEFSDRAIRAIQSLSLNQYYDQLRSDINLAIQTKADFPNNIREPFWTDLRHVVAKNAGDYVKMVKEKDTYATDNHAYDLYPNSDNDILKTPKMT